MKKVFLILILFPFFGFGQQSYSKEFILKSDNDLYISSINDQYYSSGFFFSYRFLDTTHISKKHIKEWSLHHEIYTPYKSIVTDISEHDRPFAAYLSINFSSLKAKSFKSTSKKSFELGVLGPLALGKEFQTFVHDIYDFKEPIGWKHQIKNIIGITYQYEKTKLFGKKRKQFFDFYYSYGFKAETIKTNTITSLQGRIGFKQLADADNSLAFETHLNDRNTKRNIESFLHWKVANKFVVYDATIQGSLFNNKSPVTFEPNRMQFSFELGYLFTARNWNFGYKVVYNTNERSNLTNNNGHYYASIILSKLWN